MYQHEKSTYFRNHTPNDPVSGQCPDGTIAGSTKLLPDIIKILGKKGMFNPQFIQNVYDYHGIEPMGEIEWNNEFEIVG